MSYGDLRRFGYFPRSQPRQAEGGIKARSRKGDFGETWWSKRFIEVLESFDFTSLLLPGLGQPLQARGGCLLHPGRGLRRRSVPGFHLAGPDQGRADREPSRSSWRRRGRLEGWRARA